MAKKSDDQATTEGDASGGKKGKKKLLLIVVPVVLVVGVAAWFFLLRPSGAPKAKEEPKPGPVLQLDPITINLSGSHYLKLGIALQEASTAKEGETNGAKALDLAIVHFSGRSVDELAKAEGREAVKKELTEKIREAYEDEVYEIYFTEFVMQ
jgi:flagellar FliL protein